MRTRSPKLYSAVQNMKLIRAPLAQGLQILIDKIGRMLQNLCLNINPDKCVYIYCLGTVKAYFFEIP